MENDVGNRRTRHLQAAEKEKIRQIKRSGCKNKEIAAALKVSVRTIQRIKVPPSVEIQQVKRKAKRTTKHKELLHEHCLKKGIPRLLWHRRPT